MAKLNTNISISDYLQSIGQDSSYSARKKLAQEKGISNYTGTAQQNTSLLNMMKKPETKIETPKKIEPAKKTEPKQQTEVKTPKGVTLGNKGNAPIATVESASTEIPSYEQYKPVNYQSQYNPQIKQLIDEITNGSSFNYNFSQDPVYQQMAQTAQRSGNLAMRDTMGNAAALSGGYGNSYAQVAGQQTYDSYMQNLNDQIPELQQLAYQRFSDERANKYNQLSALQSMEQTDYQKFRDSMSDYYTNRDYDYGKYRDELADQQWQQQFDYGKTRDTVSDQQWEQQFDYGKTRDTVSDKQWQQEFNYNQSRDAVSDSQWQQQYNYNQAQDAQQNSRWQQEFNYQKQQDAFNREESKKEYLNKVKQEESEAVAKESEKRIEMYTDNIDKMFSATTTDSFGNAKSKYSAKDVWNYISNSGLSDDEIAVIANGNYELRKYIESLSGNSGRSYSSGGGSY